MKGQRILKEFERDAEALISLKVFFFKESTKLAKKRGRRRRK